MGKKSENQLSLVFSYLTLRKTIGLLGIVFPFLLCLGGLIVFKTGIQYSISSYYHTGMRDVFVGTLCIIGFFLLSYRGYDRKHIRTDSLQEESYRGIRFIRRADG